MLENEQKIQEEAYKIPYHWFMNALNYGGRIYFGYISICIDLMDSFKGKKILDAGCGDGRFLGEMKNKGANQLYGIDYSERAVSFAKILVPEAKIQTGDLFSLPYENNFFDMIFMIEVLEHIQLYKVDNVLKELKRVLKKDGEIIITVPSKLKQVDKKHYQHFSKKSLEEIISPFFEIKDILGQDKAGFSFLKFIYKFLDNRYWLLRPFAMRYNIYIWPKFFNRCSHKKGNRLIVHCIKNER